MDIIKKNGVKYHMDAVKSEIEEIIGKRVHLCGSCQALVCDAEDKLALKLVKEGIKTCDRYYVFECDGYKAVDASYFSRRISSDKRIDYETRKYGGITYNIVHPEVRTRFR